MDRAELQRRNHPQPGSSIKVEPIRELAAIRRIRELNAGNFRNLCLFTMGINTAYRAGELLSLSVGQVRHLRAGDRLEVRQPKNGKYRAIVLNTSVVVSIRNWLRDHPDPRPDSPLFPSFQCDGEPLQVSALSHLVKGWCRDAGLSGNYASHSLRKTWGYQQRVLNNAPVPLLMKAYGHASQEQTLEYLCIGEDEIGELYGMEL